MKRTAWWGLGLSLTAAAVGCGGEDSKDNGSVELDGSVGDFQDDIDDLNDQLDDLGGKVDDLEGNLGGKLDDLTGRVDDLEEIPSCSEGELCIPDGLDVATSGFEPIVRALCEHEVGCCDGSELLYKFGAGIKSIDDCVASFTDFVKRGYTPDFLDDDYVGQIVEIAHALTDTSVGVRVNQDGIETCAELLGSATCTYEGEGEPGSPYCTPGLAADELEPCSMENLLVGVEQAGDTCTVNSMVPECGEGLVCVVSQDCDYYYDENTGNYVWSEGCGGQNGICAPQPAEGDSCYDDEQCGALFCNHAEGKCEERAKKGEDCAYVDPSFEYVGPFGTDNNYYQYLSLAYAHPSTQYASAGTKVDCDVGLFCDPESKKCVEPCSQGYVCSYNSDCPEGHTCNFTKIENLSNWSGYSATYGVCAPALDLGDHCTESSECESGSCGIDDGEEEECLPGLKAPGEDCANAGAADFSCSSHWCNANGKCAGLCDSSSELGTEVCTGNTYCDEYTGTSVGGKSPCKDRVANAGACDQSLDDWNLSCASGHCKMTADTQEDPGPQYTCQPKVAANAACPSGYDAQCQSNQICSAGTCMTPKAIGVSCDPGGDECARDATCWDVDPSDNTDYKCYTLESDLPNGSYCAGSSSYCSSDWCAYENDTYACKAPIALNQPCDAESSALWNCGPNAFCAYGEETSEGTCQALGTTGEECDPFYDGDDCYGGDCVYAYERWICDYGYPVDGGYCDGV